jgi:hypothetical protein
LGSPEENSSPSPTTATRKDAANPPPVAFDKRAGQHFAEQTEAADEFAAQFQVGLSGCFHMTLIIVSVRHKVKYLPRFGKNDLKLRPE